MRFFPALLSTMVLIGCTERSEKILLNEFDKETLLTTVKQNSAVMDATITNVGFLYIAVLNDGINKDPMAVYHCRLAKEKNIGISAVKIVDFTTFEKGEGWAKGKELGKSFCN